MLNVADKKSKKMLFMYGLKLQQFSDRYKNLAAGFNLFEFDAILHCPSPDGIPVDAEFLGSLPNG